MGSLQIKVPQIIDKYLVNKIKPYLKPFKKMITFTLSDPLCDSHHSLKKMDKEING